ncbi:FK506-binding protein 15-like [Fundulus diaphanus]
MFGGEDEDGDFLSPTGGAKLASLFGLDQETSQGNESFQYTAPKQPRKTSIQAPERQKQPGASTVLLASAVQAFKYINGQYVKQGKLGAAVLGNHATKEYKLLLYLSQQKPVTAARIHGGFVFTVQLNKYCTFYDDQRQNWSLMFESETNASDFCKQVCLAKANSSPSLDSVVAQDLCLGEGQAVENGDSMEVVYTGWLLQNHVFGQMFDSNQNKDKPLRLKIGAGKVIKGWEEGMLGMKKAGRRLIIIPPSLAYGSKGVSNRIPANSTLIFEVELRRVKFSKDSGSDQASASSRESAAPSPAPSPAPSVESLTSEPSSSSGKPGEPPVGAKSNSLSEQLGQNPDATKAKLISRMAKMGQPLLPFLTGAAGQPESSDSELEDTSTNRGKDCPAAPSPVQITAAAPASTHIHPHPHAAPSTALLPVIPSVGPYSGLPGSSHAFQTSAAPSQMQAVGQVYPPQAVPYVGSGDVTSFLMTEARQHNTEIRLAMGKVADKVDQLASKISDLEKQGTHSVGVSCMTMETSMIVHNINRIVQENESLKKEMFEKSSRIEEQNRKIGDLINQNQKYMEQSHQLLEQRNNSLKSSSEHNQARLLQAEQDKVRLTEELASSSARVSQLQLEATAHQQKAAKLQCELNSALQDSESHCQRIAALEAQLEELKEAGERAQNQYRSEKQRRKEMELRVSAIEEELQDLKSDKENLERTLSERKKKWQAERQHRDEEVEELRKSSQQELDKLRAQLRKARTCNDSAASEQLAQLQGELEEEWKRKSEQMLAVAKERHHRELSELVENRDALQDKLTRLQEKHLALEQQGGTVREKLERRVAELERKVEEQDSTVDTAAEVKRVMNGVFRSLRAEFELSESYSGQAVLGVIVSTIKNVTLQLLSGTDQSAPKPENKQEGNEGKESEDVKQLEQKSHLHVNGEREVKEEEIVEQEHVMDAGYHQVNEALMVREAAPESETPSQEEDSEAADLCPVPSPEPASQDPQAEPVESVVQQEKEQASAADACTEEKDLECLGPDGRPDESPLPDNCQENAAALSCGVDGNRDAGSLEGEDHVEEITAAASLKAFGPPANPPPPPAVEPNNSSEGTSLTGAMGEENGEELFFQVAPPAKPPAAAGEEEEEEEMSLKGRPPPAPLFGEEEEDDDLDWLN